MNTDINPQTVINWPDGLSEQQFLDHYWQKKPLLMRQAFPGFSTPLPADELAGLSLEPDTTPRLITQDSNGTYHLEYGPFDERRFSSLNDNNWSLLVTDVEKHLPELMLYLQPFRFLPSWRIDDLMVSYAPVGASVGAHIDEYDVFLLQASGTRQWSIDNDLQSLHEFVQGSELKLLANFKATDCWELEAGDALYLPPGIAHHGVAIAEECTTWSIGFRAPAAPDLIMRMAELLCDALPHARYTDPRLKPAQPGQITAEALSRFHEIWKNATQLDIQTISKLAGQILTESTAPVSQHEHDQLDDESQDGPSSPTDTVSVILAPFSRLLWHEPESAHTDTDDEHESNSRRVQLYVDGSDYQCSERLAIQLSDRRQPVTISASTHSIEDRDVCNVLLASGSLISVENLA